MCQRPRVLPFAPPTRPRPPARPARPYRAKNVACPKCDSALLFFPSTMLFVCFNCSRVHGGKGGAA
jgi:hypothetical protein